MCYNYIVSLLCNVDSKGYLCYNESIKIQEERIV